MIVAFHFQFSDRAGWKCADCRTKGLETKRRCGWSRQALETPPRVVWARKKASTSVCPKSFITANSAAWLEAYYAWRRLGGRGLEGLSARDAEAFLILEQELAEIDAQE